MRSTPRRAHGHAGRGALAVLSSAVVLTACGGSGGSGQEAAGSAGAASSSSPAALTSGLLKPAAFGPQATVVAITVEQLQKGAGLAAAAGNLQVTPPQCANAVHGTQPQVGDLHDVAAQTATTGGSSTVEVLFRGAPAKNAVSRLAAAVTACPRAQISSPKIGTAALTFESLPVAHLGDGAAVVRYTTALTQANGAKATVPALIGLVQDGDRVITLISIAAGGPPPDPAAFTALLSKAYTAEHDALG